MKQAITIEADLKDFIKKETEEVLLCKKDGRWFGVPKSELLKESNLKVIELEEQVKRFEVEHREMKKLIEKFKKALVEYGFNQFKGGE